MALIERLMRAMIQHTRDTGLRLDIAHLELHVHSADLSEYHRTLDPFRFHEADKVVGIRIVENRDVAIGHPELRSTWRWVL